METQQTGQAIAEMWILGNWKMRLRLLRKLKKEIRPGKKQLAELIIIAGFVDICGIFYGRDWVIDTVHEKKRSREG